MIGKDSAAIRRHCTPKQVTALKEVCLRFDNGKRLDDDSFQALLESYPELPYRDQDELIRQAKSYRTHARKLLKDRSNTGKNVVEDTDSSLALDQMRQTQRVRPLLDWLIILKPRSKVKVLCLQLKSNL
jgi:phage/plasmid-associated DNA primase